MTARVLGFGAVLCALVAAGCGVPAQTAPLASETSTTSLPPEKPTKAYTVEELATTVGCTPRFQGQAADFRQANCETGGDDYLLLDFATAEGQDAWLEYAVLYGGRYLIGERWVLASSDLDKMTTLYEELGGLLKENPHMTSDGMPAGGHQQMGGS